MKEQGESQSNTSTLVQYHMMRKTTLLVILVLMCNSMKHKNVGQPLHSRLQNCELGCHPLPCHVVPAVKSSAVLHFQSRLCGPLSMDMGDAMDSVWVLAVIYSAC